MLLLKGFSLTNVRVDFSLSDCPVYITSETIALAGIKNSKIIRAGTIVRGDSDTGIYEGDQLYEGDEYLGTVVFAKGFKLFTSEGSIKNLPDLEHIKVVEGTKESIGLISKLENRTDLLFKYCDSVIYLHVFLYKTGNGLIAVSGKSCKHRYIVPDDVRFFTGIVNDEGERIFFGDVINGNVVVLHNNQPMLKVRAGWYEQIN